MAKNRRKAPEGWRIRYYVGLIRQIRGKPLLEALHRLQGGICAYDERPCALLLPQVDRIARFTTFTKAEQVRFSTIDHIVPRALGGENKFSNLVMAAQGSNAQKGCYAPIGRWVPRFRHTSALVDAMIKKVENERWKEAHKLASRRNLTREEAIELLIWGELMRIEVRDDFKFYPDSELMVA